MTDIRKSLLTSGLNINHDDDGNVSIVQMGKQITMTPRQCLELVEVLKVIMDITEKVNED